MGSTLEAAICFSLVIIILGIFIVYPSRLWEGCQQQGITAVEEFSFRLRSDELTESKNIEGHIVYASSPEKMNTMLNGIIDSVKIAGG